MFHLLVAYKGWSDGAGTISTSRIYIKSDDELGRQFLKEGKLDISQIIKLPALLVDFDQPIPISFLDLPLDHSHLVR